MFYHLTRSSPEDTVTALLVRALVKGWRLMIRGTDPARLDRLDAQLWLQPEDGFVPHGREGGAQDADQPVLIGQGAIANDAQAMMLLDGAVVTEDELRHLERVWLIFDGEDPEAVSAARAQWTALTEAGAPAQYWSEESGKWQMKAEKQ